VLVGDPAPKHLAAPGGPARRGVIGLLVLVAVVTLAAAWGLDRTAPVEADQPARGGSEGGDPGPATTGSSTSVPVSASTATTERGPLGSGQTVTLAFAGDMNFEGSNRTRLAGDPGSLLAAIAPTLQAADVAVGNLETAIGTGGSPWPGKEFTFRAPPAALDALRSAGFDAVSMANNHGLDFGPDALAESIAAKRAQPPGFVIGIGGDEDEAYTPFTTTVRGQRIAVIGATQVIGDSMIPAWTATTSQPGLASAKRVERLVEEVRRARAGADTVVVFLHWGIEKETCPSGDQTALAARLVEAGADVIVGGHAHRVQGAGRLGGALVGYGLGNFLWNAQSEESATTGVLQVTVTGRRVDRYEWVPARIRGGSPEPLAGTDATEAVARWDALRPCTGLTP
jgi:poly-gamma-glutamate synthesis protein (capsule biosynthesis protein)